MWYNVPLKSKYNELKDLEDNANNHTNSLVKTMDKVRLVNQSDFVYKSRKQQFNSELLKFKFSKPLSKEKLKFNLQSLLIQEEDPYSDFILKFKPSKNKKLKQCGFIHNILSKKIEPIKQEKVMIKNNSMATLPKVNKDFNHKYKYNLSSPSKLNNCKQKTKRMFIPSASNPLFLNYTKHTQKIKLNRDKLSKVEESLRRNVNMSITGLNWFSMEYD